MKKIRHAIREKAFDTFNYAFMTLSSLLCLYPFYYILIYSISDPVRVTRGIFLWPVGFSIASYKALFGLHDVFSAFLVSASRTILGLIITVFSCSILAYVFSKDRFILRKFLYRLLVISLYIDAGLVPWYLLMYNLGLKNNYLLYIVPSAIVGFYVILLKTYFEQLSPAIEESAFIDGAGYFRTFISIVLPLSKPVLATIAVFAGVNQWNSFMDNFFLVSKVNLQTLQVILYNYLNAAASLSSGSVDIATLPSRNIITPESIKMCITMIVVSPIIFLYPFMQRYFTKGIMLGAVKG